MFYLLYFIVRVLFVSGVARISGARGELSQWLPLLLIMNFKKNNQNYSLNFLLFGHN